MKLEIGPLLPEHLPAAAALFCERYQALRGRVASLPEQYESPTACLSRLADLAASSPGVAALSQGRLVGYLTGYLLPEFIGKRSAYSPEWANAAELDASRRIYAEMYAALSVRWLHAGCIQHVISLLANDAAGEQAFHWLGFGLAGVDGMRGLAMIDAAAPGLVINQASEVDLPDVRKLIQALEQHVAAAPVFWLHDLDDPAEWLLNPRNIFWLARIDGSVVGGMGIGPANQDAAWIIRDEATASIVRAYTWQSARRQGIASALLARCLHWAQEQGYSRCSVDYETANSLASRFWGRWFSPVCYSLNRVIDDRLVPEEKN